MEVKVWPKENWIKKLKSVEIKCFWKAVGTLFFDHKKDTQFLELLTLEPVNQKLRS
jgi:hypothetical protein